MSSRFSKFLQAAFLAGVGLTSGVRAAEFEKSYPLEGMEFGREVAMDVTMRGDIVAGDYDRLRDAIQGYGGRISLVLDSNGGEVRDASLIAALVVTKNIAVHMTRSEGEGPCYSGCSLIFFSAYRKVISPDTKVGVHQVSDGLGHPMPAETKKMAHWFQQLGVSQGVINAMVKTPPDKVFILDAKALSHEDGVVVVGSSR